MKREEEGKRGESWPPNVESGFASVYKRMWTMTEETLDISLYRYSLPLQ